MSNLLPYRRPASLPIIQRERVDAANCFWCVWRKRPEKWVERNTREHPPLPGWCSHPSNFARGKNENSKYTGACNDWNERGECDLYQPKFGIRILTLLRILKKPFRYIEVQDESL